MKKQKTFKRLLESRASQLEKVLSFTLHFTQDPDIQQTFKLNEWTV